MVEQRIALTLLLTFCLVLSTLPLVNATEDSWTTLTEMPTARSGLGIAVVDGKIYAIGGFNGSYLATNEMYDPETDTWTTKKPMPTARARLQANVVDNKIYLIGGGKYVAIWPFYQSAEGLNEVYDPLTDSWSTKTPDPKNFSLYSSAVVDNEIYMMNAIIETSFPTQIYDAENDSWSFGKKMPTAAFVAVAGATTGVLAPKRIYVLGGMIESNVATNLNQVYDPEVDMQANGTSMPTPRWSLAVAVVNDELYAIGGKLTAETFSTANEKYTPVNYIPEFPSWTIMPLVLIAATFALSLQKRLSKQKLANYL